MDSQGIKRGIAGKARQKLGYLGESLAVERLISLGYTLLQRNYRCQYGEIDLIAEQGEDLVFVEVKLRRGTDYGLPEEAITRRKWQRIERAATYYLGSHVCDERSWRIDVVAVQLSKSGRLTEIRVYDHATIE
ncbi:YraN family protein [Ktedonosporobacter rubrisoli]|uniref:UPF0102 protein EPA93_41520 n=1 Tax=Ktedonosporobacter rubrisoli TaxID=2509675 RepID=A0A4P6K6S5_KTERU|nr:YraN family protein [Ktedonosporobacter rubrisoli]QBD83742.1 YraN family protein [Ktedonosporobacter rubrisoli]